MATLKAKGFYVENMEAEYGSVWIGQFRWMNSVTHDFQEWGTSDTEAEAWYEALRFYREAEADKVLAQDLKKFQKAKKIRDRLSDLGYKAIMARSKLEDELDKLKARKDWKELCALVDMSPDCDSGDWMC
jgi:phosphoglycolate phosphatase-like HAD superfamily hydrolase